jgi:hypothetical protein
MIPKETMSGCVGCIIVAGLFVGCGGSGNEGNTNAQGGEETLATAEASHGVTTLFGQAFGLIATDGNFLAPSVQFGPGTAFSNLPGRNVLPGLGTAGGTFSEVFSSLIPGFNGGVTSVASSSGIDLALGTHPAHAIHVDSVSSLVVSSCSSSFAEASIVQATVLGLTVDGVAVPLVLGIENETHFVSDLKIVVSDTRDRPTSPYFSSIAPPTVISQGPPTVGALASTGLFIQDLTNGEKIWIGVADAECTDPPGKKGHGHDND